jgi:parallel beta-helix repeat protein
MSSLSIQPPFPIFTGIDGQPLENGYVWIGVANLDPEGNPIAVYWDEALTIPAPQPIRTVSGYPARAGSPARLYVNSNYSIRVQDKNGTLVYSSPVATEQFGNLINARQVVYDPAGFGAVPTTVQTKLRETVSVKDFGAVGDGSTDDTLAIQKAIDAVAAAGDYGVVTVPQSDGEYIASTILLKEGVTLRGEGGVLKWKDNTCTNPAQAYYFLYNFGANNVTYENLVIDGNRANNTQWLVADAITAGGNNVVVRGCRIFNTPDSGIMFSDAPNGRCVDNWIETGGDLGIYINAPEVTPARGDMLCTGNVIKGFPYGGIGIKRSIENCLVANNLITGCGNGITVEDFGTGAGGAPDHLLITDNLLEDIGFPFAATPFVAQVGITLNGCSNVVVANNKFNRVSGNMLILSGTIDSLIDGNHFIGYPTSPVSGVSICGLIAQTRTGVTPSRNTVVNNVFRECKNFGIRFETGDNNIITNNFVHINAGTGSSGIRIDNPCSKFTITNNRVYTAGTDTEIFSGATEIVLRSNYLSNGATAWQRDGNVRTTAVTTPIGSITPFYPGQMAWVTTGGPKLFMSYGISNTEWVQIAGPLFEATAAQIGDITSTINTVDKFRTKQILNTTSGALMYATGANASSAWTVVDGSSSITPA